MARKINNQKAELPWHNPESPWENWSIPTTSQLRLFPLRKLYLGPFRLRPFSLVAVPQSCDSCDGPNDKYRLQDELWHLAFTTSTVAPLQVARLGSQDKQNTPWFLGSNWKHMPLMPLVMTCQIKNQKSRASRTQTWITLDKLVATYNFAASPFLHSTVSI